jgi:hypothetical protein
MFTFKYLLLNIKRNFLKAIKEFVYEIMARQIWISTLNQGLQKVQICKETPFMKKKKKWLFFFFK